MMHSSYSGGGQIAITNTETGQTAACGRGGSCTLDQFTANYRAYGNPWFYVTTSVAGTFYRGGGANFYPPQSYEIVDIPAGGYVVSDYNSGQSWSNWNQIALMI